MTEKAERIQAHWKNTEQTKAKAAKGKHGATSVIETGSYQTYTTTGWRPTCTCQTYASGINGPSDVGELEGVPFEPVPAIILDPFCGSGSTMIAARRLGRQGIGLDLSFPYLRDQARPRLELDRLADWGQGREAETAGLDGLPLFALS